MFLNLLTRAKIMGIFLLGFHCLHPHPYCTNSSGSQVVSCTPCLPGGLEHPRDLGHMPVTRLPSDSETALAEAHSTVRNKEELAFTFGILSSPSFFWQPVSINIFPFFRQRVISGCFGMLLNVYNTYQL